jgi:hypothetical protein
MIMNDHQFHELVIKRFRNKQKGLKICRKIYQPLNIESWTSHLTYPSIRFLISEDRIISHRISVGLVRMDMPWQIWVDSVCFVYDCVSSSQWVLIYKSVTALSRGNIKYTTFWTSPASKRCKDRQVQGSVSTVKYPLLTWQT